MTQPGARRVDASMTLLTEILQRPLDPGYAAAARRRTSVGRPAAQGMRSGRFAFAMLVAGLLLGVSAASVRDTATSRASARQELIAQIDAGRRAAEAKAAEITTLTSQISALDALVLDAEPGSGGAQGLQGLGLITGAAAVTGPGLEVTVDDAPDSGAAAPNADPRATGRNQDGIVRARDLQIITNSLWASGAEAMAINGQRLTSTTAIRFAGEALIVNYRPLNRPYVISAIGDPGSLPSTFANGAGGTYLATLKGSFGISVHTRTVAEVTLPASSSAATRLALPVAGPATPSPSPSPSSPGSSPGSSLSSLSPDPLRTPTPTGAPS